MDDITIQDFTGELTNGQRDILALEDKCSVREGEILPPQGSSQIRPIEIRIPPALRAADLSKLQTRTDVLAALSSGLPLNEYGLPKLIYRPDMIDPSLFCGANSPDTKHQEDRYLQMQEALNSAAIPLTYYEGFPALPDGSPLWDILPFEDVSSFESFQSYLVLPGARQLTLHPESSTRKLIDLFHTCYWSWRSRANDLFAVVHARRMREQRIIKTENRHFLEAEGILTKLYAMIPDMEWSKLAEEPEKFVSVMEKLTKIQRTALGLSANGISKEAETKVPSISVILRQLTAEENVRVESGNAETMSGASQLLKNPDDLMKMQELILKFGNSS